MDDVKKKILLEILNNRLYEQGVIDEHTRDKILMKIWEQITLLSFITEFIIMVHIDNYGSVILY